MLLRVVENPAFGQTMMKEKQFLTHSVGLPRDFMNKRQKRTAVLLSAALLSASLLTSCRTGGEAVLTYGDSVITDNQFTYYLATYKNVYLNTYADMKDTAAFYSAELPDGRTGEEYLFDQTVENVSMSLVCMELFDKNGLTLDPAVAASIDSYVQSFIDDYAGGDKKALNSRLAEYGINVNMLREIYLNEEKGTALYDYLYGENGTVGVTDEELDAYYRENYIRLRHIYVNNKFYYETTEEGYASYDADGNLITHPYEGEALTAKNAVIAAIDTALSMGADFETVYEQYSEDRYYVNGYYLTAQTDFIDEVEKSAADLAPGEYTKVESDVGTHYVLRMELDEKPWEDEANADFFDTFEDDVKYQAFVNYVKQYLPDVVRNEEKLAEYSVEDSAVNYRF